MPADTLIAIGFAILSLGDIREEDGSVERTFRLLNGGSEAVRIVEGYTSCGCTTIAFDRGADLMPGDTTAITLRFNPQGKSGDFEETGTLVYGPGRKRARVALTGRCIPSEASIARQFPIILTPDTRLSANRFDLGIMQRGNTRTVNVTILHRDAADYRERIAITFTADASTPTGLQHIKRRLVTYEGETPLSFTVTLDVMVR